MAPRIAVCGPSYPDPQALAWGEEVGRLLAEAGAVVYTGGLGGLMEAVSRGARQAGGLTVGILPGESAEEANPYVQIPVVTGMSHARNVILVRSVQGVIAVRGSFGTLSEIALALKMGRPVVLLGSWKGIDPAGRPWPVQEARTPAEAVERILAAVGKRGR